MKLSTLLQSVTQHAASIDGVRWYPVRPATAENTFYKHRIKAAWRVLIGASDAIEWDHPPEDAASRAECCPRCDSGEWDCVTAERGRERDVPFNRCSRCENEWGATQDDLCRKPGCTNPTAGPVLAFCKEHGAPPVPFA